MARPVTAPYTAAELAAILARAEAKQALNREAQERGGQYYFVSFSPEEAIRLVAELTRAREALFVIAAGMTDADAPDVMKLEPMEFRAAMWIWSQHKARAALEEPADGDTERA